MGEGDGDTEGDDDSSWSDDGVTITKEDGVDFISNDSNDDDSSWNDDGTTITTDDGEGAGVTTKMEDVIRTNVAEGDSSSREGDGEEGVKEGEGDGMGITGTA